MVDKATKLQRPEGSHQSPCDSVTVVVERVAVLEERLAVAERSNRYLRKELLKAVERLESIEDASDDHAASIERIGGHLFHEQHHREVAEQLDRKRERNEWKSKIIGDMLSKTAIALGTILISTIMYILNEIGIFK